MLCCSDDYTQCHSDPLRRIQDGRQDRVYNYTDEQHRFSAVERHEVVRQLQSWITHLREAESLPLAHSAWRAGLTQIINLSLGASCVT